ncbi:MAG TPA: 8-oxoguanine deaminase [Actinobacteria bacterium]|nr:8-oxoguanine deaminase [Actinomycetota bacterium]
MTRTLLVRDAEVLVTMDPDLGEIPGGGLFARDGWIERVGPSSELPDGADEVFDAAGHVVLPGLVNTHHHLFQTLTRAVPEAATAPLFPWLQTLYPIWGRLTADDVAVATLVGLAELARSGCTTTSDHLYLFPNDVVLDVTVEAARDVGLRFHPARGSMSLGVSAGGLPPDELVEDERAILADTARVVDAFHDPRPGAMTRIVVAPCSPFSVTPELMVESARFARAHGLALHTHLAETRDEVAFCEATFDARPVAYAQRLGWLGDDVWFAHAVHLDDAELGTLAASGTGVAHCPTSNLRLASGLAPLRSWLDHGVRVGLGVDGSASNDGGSLLAEARQAMLLARLDAAEHGGPLLAARSALHCATRGGAAVLGREDLGALTPGRVADVAAWRIDDLEHAGIADPVSGLLLAQPTPVARSWVGGHPVVVDGKVVTFDVDAAVRRHHAARRRLLGDA